MRRMYDKKQLDSYYKGQSGGGTKLYQHLINLYHTGGEASLILLSSNATPYNTVSVFSADFAKKLTLLPLIYSDADNYYTSTITEAKFSEEDIILTLTVTTATGSNTTLYITSINNDAVSEL